MLAPASFNAAASRQRFLDEVVEEVFRRTDADAAKILESVEARSAGAFEAAQRNQIELFSEMKMKLERYTESYNDLAKQNAALRMGLELAVRHIQALRWTTPTTHGPTPKAPWALPGAGLPTPHQFAGALNRRNAGGVGGGVSTLPPMPEENSDSDTPKKDEIMEPLSSRSRSSSVTSAEDVSVSPPKTPVTPSGLSACDELEPPTLVTPPPSIRRQPSTTNKQPRMRETRSTTTLEPDCITLTLRRANGQPLGLKVCPDTDLNCLHVEGIQAGTVADAWNRQCLGEPRKILLGDRVIAVNGVTKVEGMRKEFGQKLLLKLELLRN